MHETTFKEIQELIRKKKNESLAKMVLNAENLKKLPQGNSQNSMVVGGNEEAESATISSIFPPPDLLNISTQSVQKLIGILGNQPEVSGRRQISTWASNGIFKLEDYIHKQLI